MLCRKNSASSVKCHSGSSAAAAAAPVHLNVYDLTSMNVYARWVGLGVYHSAVQVHGVEYAFGAHEYPTTGISEAEPRQCDGFAFRKAILIGWTEMGRGEVRGVMEKLAEEYKGNAYNLTTKNCNHFCNDACVKLTGKSIPSWINRIARIGALFNCMVPVKLNPIRVRDQRLEEKAHEGEKKLRSRSNRFTAKSTN